MNNIFFKIYKRNNKTHYIIERYNLNQALQIITDKQSKNNTFYNLSIKPYKSQLLTIYNLIDIIEG